MARTLELDTLDHPGNTGTANIVLSSDGTTTMPVVNINGGAIDSTAIGAQSASTIVATTLTVSGAVSFTNPGDLTFGALTLTGNGITGGTSTLTGNTTVGGTFGVTGTSTLGTTTAGALTVTSLNGITLGTGWNNNIQTAAEENIAVGASALSGIETGSTGNVAMGYHALHGTLNNASSNVAIGYRALSAGDNVSGGQTVSGSNNVAIGTNCLYNLTSGYVNVSIGYNSGDGILTGLYNICIGRFADSSGSYGIALGHNVTVAGSTCGIGQQGNIITADFMSSGTWSYVSDVRKKIDIRDCGLGLSFIDALRTTTFYFRPAEEYPEEWGDFEDELDDDGEFVKRTYPEMDTVKKRYGMIAQEVKEAIDEAGAADYFTGWSEEENGRQGLGYSDFVLPLIKAVQELSTKVKALETA